jgi:hypothetical protein
MRSNWAAAVVAIEPVAVFTSEARAHRLLRVAGISFAVSGMMIIGAMIVGLTLEAALKPVRRRTRKRSYGTKRISLRWRGSIKSRAPSKRKSANPMLMLSRPSAGSGAVQ